MNITFTFKNFEPSDHLRKYAGSRFQRLEKFIKSADSSEIQVNLSVEKYRQMAEVILISDHMHLSAYEESEDMYATIDMVLDKLSAQAKRVREKQVDRKRQAADKAGRMDVISFGENESRDKAPTIIQTDDFVPKPMHVDEAAMQLETLDYGFLVFRNAENDHINVIYRLKTGDFGLIDPGT